MNRILLISAFTPSKFSAGQNYTLNLLNDLADDFEIDLIYFKYGDQTYTSNHRNINVVRVVHLSLFHKIINAALFPIVHPFFSVRFSFSMMLFVLRLNRKVHYDFIYFDFSQVFLYSIFIKGQRKILMAHDIIYQKFIRERTAFECWWARRTERVFFRSRLTSILTFSKKDSELIEKLCGVNAVVVNFFISSAIRDIRLEKHSLKEVFCFFGAWNRPENAEGLKWFIDNVLPHLSSKEFIVIGPNLPQRIIDLISGIKNIEYCGFVENPYVTLSQSSALIAPLFKGAGVKVKVIESLACGTPVIGTPIASEGIDKIMDGGLTDCSTAQQFVDAILNFKFAYDQKLKLRNLFLKMYSKNFVRSVLT